MNEGVHPYLISQEVVILVHLKVLHSHHSRGGGSGRRPVLQLRRQDSRGGGVGQEAGAAVEASRLTWRWGRAGCRCWG